MSLFSALDLAVFRVIHSSIEVKGRNLHKFELNYDEPKKEILINSVLPEVEEFLVKLDGFGFALTSPRAPSA